MATMKGQQIFLIDLAMDVLMLLLALRFAGKRPRPGRLLAAALLGAAVARGASSIPPGVRAACWMPTAGAMIAVHGGFTGVRGIVRGTLLLLAAAGLVGGTVQALLGATGSLMAALLLGTCTSVCTAFAALRARRAGQAVCSARVICRYRGRRAVFEGIVDSGNCLRDYLTQLPVVVVPERAGRTGLCMGDAALRPIFADTAGGRQMMWCFRPDELVIDADGRTCAVRAMLALSPGLSGNTPALIPAALLARGETAAQGRPENDEAYDCRNDRENQ